MGNAAGTFDLEAWEKKLVNTLRSLVRTSTDHPSQEANTDRLFSAFEAWAKQQVMCEAFILIYKLMVCSQSLISSLH
jgi:hypothetical protein